MTELVFLKDDSIAQLRHLPDADGLQKCLTAEQTSEGDAQSSSDVFNCTAVGLFCCRAMLLAIVVGQLCAVPDLYAAFVVKRDCTGILKGTKGSVQVSSQCKIH